MIRVFLAGGIDETDEDRRVLLVEFAAHLGYDIIFDDDDPELDEMVQS